MRETPRRGRAALLLVFALASEARADPMALESTVGPIRTEPVELRAPVHELRFGGLTRARRRAQLAFKTSGTLVEQGELGAKRARGEVVARIDPAELENAVLGSDAALYGAKVQWRRQRRERDRMERLVEVGARTARDLEEARSAEEAARALVTAAESRLRLAERRLDEATLRAPFAGTLSEILLEEGEQAAPGTPIAVLADDSELEVSFDLPESVVHRIRLGAPVAVEFPLARLPGVQTRISSITYVGGTRGKLFPVLADIPEGSGVLAGMSAEVVIALADEPVLLVPLAAIVDPSGQRPAVFRLREGRVQKVPVEVVDLAEDRAVVRGALEAGEPVVVAGQASLLDGQAVEAQPPASIERP